MWYAEHNTPNPCGLQPDAPISHEDKFIKEKGAFLPKWSLFSEVCRGFATYMLSLSEHTANVMLECWAGCASVIGTAYGAADTALCTLPRP